MNGQDKLLLDTNIVLYLLNGDKHLAEYFYKRELYVSFVTELELLSFWDLPENEKIKIKSFLEETVIFDIDSETKKILIEIRKKYKLKLPDSLVLASAIRNNCSFISSDKRLFKVKECKIIEYHP